MQNPINHYSSIWEAITLVKTPLALLALMLLIAFLVARNIIKSKRKEVESAPEHKRAKLIETLRQEMSISTDRLKGTKLENVILMELRIRERRHMFRLRIILISIVLFALLVAYAFYQFKEKREVPDSQIGKTLSQKDTFVIKAPPPPPATTFSILPFSKIVTEKLKSMPHLKYKSVNADRRVKIGYDKTNIIQGDGYFTIKNGCEVIVYVNDEDCFHLNETLNYLDNFKFRVDLEKSAQEEALKIFENNINLYQSQLKRCLED
ncbi:hypothetical protein [Dyadobacter frigoris]|uniref:Uncharacterized protein n=1 Tax=Dyadobacter frigoris TaxID=2576211 RepID=A0A4U6CQK8_9BACT|nr:hypothetical protein [Dyadobacter frigoris]TKT85731.1 hypothetical protein FDK13_33395 [Dyadobacter frigoris]